ncbi:MAG: glycoside hydrolase family 36 protein [Paraclostridium sp.]
MKVETNMPIFYTTELIERDDEKNEYRISIKHKENMINEEYIIKLKWNFPILDIVGRWHPVCGFDRELKADWNRGIKSMTAQSAPVITFFSEDGNNRYTVAVSETKKEVIMNCGVHEEDGTMCCIVEMKLGPDILNEDYEVRLLIDERNIPYYKALHEVQQWWEIECFIEHTKVPKDAKEPMYSLWYSYHQELKDNFIEKECMAAKKLGFKTVIVDDGWQTDDTNRGYSFCGDWKIAESKIKDMKLHVKSVHDIGMKYMLWFSIPYIGKNSNAWSEFKDKLIIFSEWQSAGILDIRYKEVREYLKNIYINAVKEWDIDGLKLDFIDEFYMRDDTPVANEKMDYKCLQDALDCLLSETIGELKKIDSEILIEFRQKYIGPNIRKYGNIFRVGDCPNSGISNRVGIVDLRLLSGNTAIHSDMVMWNKNETPENASLQIINCLFATLQLSVKLEELDYKQECMIKNYINFMKDNKELLQNSLIQAKEPQNLYPEVRVENDISEIIALYSEDRVIQIDERKKKSIIVNGTKGKKVYVKATNPHMVKIKNINCFGDIKEESILIIEGIKEIEWSIGGRIEISYIK